MTKARDLANIISGGFTADDIPNLDTAKITTGTFADARMPSTVLNSNVDLTNLSASNLTSGTLPDARFPATLPAVSGANLTNLPGGGKVLQVLTATDSTVRSTTSSTFTNASTTLSLTITPSSTSSKILINITTGWYDGNTGGTAYISIFRDSTNLGNSSTGMLSMALHGMQSSIAMTHLDSPSSTSALTYELRMRCGAGTSRINQQSSMGNIVVMEIGS